jgi:hypothetical protein
MGVEEVRKYISERLTETKQWTADGFPGEIRDVSLRKYPCDVTPIAYISDLNKEGKGVRFKLTWRGESGVTSCSHLEIYLVPEGFCGERSKYPYATIYAANSDATSRRLQKDNCKVIEFREQIFRDSSLGPTVPIHQFFDFIPIRNDQPIDPSDRVVLIRVLSEDFKDSRFQLFRVRIPHPVPMLSALGFEILLDTAHGLSFSIRG